MNDWGILSKKEFKLRELEHELAHETETRVEPPMAKAVTSVKLTDALAVAYAAYRINNETYIKDTRRFSCEENKTQFDNKSLVRFYWETKTQDPASQYTPSDFEMFEPTEEDYAAVEQARVWIKRYVMLGLGDLDEFKRDMISELSKDEVPVRSMGRIAFAPQFVKRDQAESGLKKEIRVEYRDSKYVGNIGDSVEGVIRILDRFWSARWENYNYIAVMDGNLISFMNKFEHEVNSMKRIKAKVKGHGKNRMFSVDESRLNYVKLYKV